MTLYHDFTELYQKPLTNLFIRGRIVSFTNDKAGEGAVRGERSRFCESRRKIRGHGMVGREREGPTTVWARAVCEGCGDEGGVSKGIRWKRDKGGKR